MKPSQSYIAHPGRPGPSIHRPPGTLRSRDAHASTGRLRTIRLTLMRLWRCRRGSIPICDRRGRLLQVVGPSLASRPWKTRSIRMEPPSYGYWRAYVPPRPGTGVRGVPRGLFVNDRDLADPEDGFVIVQAE